MRTLMKPLEAAGILLLLLVVFAVGSRRKRRQAAPDVDVLTMRSVIEFFTRHRPDLDDVRGILLRQPQPGGYQMTQMFIDGSSEPVGARGGMEFGRSFVAGRLDDELTAMYAGNDLVVFE
jgi:hypothetical protein